MHRHAAIPGTRRSVRPGGGGRASRRGIASALGTLALAALLPAAAQAGHGLLDHPAPGFNPGNPPSSTTNSGGPGADWELIESFTTGNPHTDLDFFAQGGETYASVGTLAIGPNAGGQTIVKLTDGGEVNPSFVSSHPSAACVSDPSQATGLQHDVEAAPKGDVPLNTENPFADRSDTQVIIDATDAAGRCHDQGVLGIAAAPQGGLEIVDVTDIENPVEIGLTSHIGESHTVNVDPKRPHIAFSVTSDLVTVSADDGDLDNDGDTGELVRENEDPADTDRFDLDGFEVVDFSSCMGFPAGTSSDAKRTACRPQVYRYRYPSVETGLGHTIQEGVFGCHELEIYPDDRVTCGSGNSLLAFDLSNAFNDMGTPNDFTDDKPRGTPLPCKERMSSSEPPFASGATVIDCVDGTNDTSGGVGGVSASQDLTVPGWIAQGSPSLEGVEFIGAIHHQGGGPGQGSVPPFNTVEDLAFNHETELTGSGQHLIATDERGGGVLPPGSTCTPVGDNIEGNGGVHFYKTSALGQGFPISAEEAQSAYAKTPEGANAIFRARVRTKAQANVCTAHVFQQIPGENRIFMGWYSQGTRVLDFVEERSGRVRFEEAGYFIPENANTWVSHVFKTEQNPDGTTTYYGATGDFALGETGRNSVDVYKVTLPPAPRVGGAGGGGGGAGGGAGAGGGTCTQRIAGTKSKDKLVGSIAGDRIAGKAGKDRIKGRAGDDCLSGGRDSDRIAGGDGKDQLKGGPGRDVLKGGGKADTIRAKGKGRDLVVCGKGRDKAFVDSGDKARGCEKLKRR